MDTMPNAMAPAAIIPKEKTPAEIRPTLTTPTEKLPMAMTPTARLFWDGCRSRPKRMETSGRPKRRVLLV